MKEGGKEYPKAIRQKLAGLPARPGVYLLKRAGGEVLYVGKALSLRSRVRSYFQAGAQHSPRIQALLRHVEDFEVIVTDSELEALILEANLIKEHRPRYNVRLRDDKAYPYLKVTVNERFPRVLIVRRPRRDGARYYGPYTDSQAVRETLKFLRRLFPVRTCNLDLEGALDYRVCLQYHIHRCLGPCAALCDEATYRKVIDEVCLFLEGRQERLIQGLRQRMQEAAARLEFERAARLRDQARALERIVERQKVVSAPGADEDVLGLAREGALGCVEVFFVRDGKLVGHDPFFLDIAPDASDGEIVSQFLRQYYQEAAFVPREILLPAPVEEAGLLEDWLAGRRGGAVTLRTPQRGARRQLVEMAVENARLALADQLARGKRGEEAREEGLAALAAALGLPGPPRRIEAFDISNTQGREAVASMVVFEEGRPKTGEYRRFRMATPGPDDYAMMREAIARRFRRGLAERQELARGAAARARQEGGEEIPGATGFAAFPDLLLVDGGRGQLNAALDVLRELDLQDIPAVGLAKREEEIFVEHDPDPIRLPGTSPALHILQHIRDEAHRFALAYHKNLRGRRTRRSALDTIPGVGPRWKKALLRHFGSVAAIRRASLEQLLQVPRLPRPLAERIYQELR